MGLGRIASVPKWQTLFLYSGRAENTLLGGGRVCPTMAPVLSPSGEGIFLMQRSSGRQKPKKGGAVLQGSFFWLESGAFHQSFVRSCPRWSSRPAAQASAAASHMMASSSCGGHRARSRSISHSYSTRGLSQLGSHCGVSCRQFSGSRKGLSFLRAWKHFTDYWVSQVIFRRVAYAPPFVAVRPVTGYSFLLHLQCDRRQFPPRQESN